jgi:hypothetical protein
MTNAFIHHFGPNGPPHFDDEGDQMVDYYYQLIDKNDDPLTGLIGPYRWQADAESAAQRAANRRDF